MERNKKIFLCITTIIIIIGIIMTAVFGINKAIEFSNTKQIHLYLATDVDFEEFRKITDAVFKDQKVKLQKVELFNDEISIKTTEITEEQLHKLVSFTNYIYGLDNHVADIEILSLTGMDIKDIIVPYILPILISLALIMAYMGIKYRKHGIMKSVLTPLFWVVVVEALYFSMIAITRLPIGRYTMPLGLVLLIITITTVVYKFENEER